MTDDLWPDALELGDTVHYDGHKYEVVGTGPGSATLEREDGVTADVGRWAISNSVYIEVEHTVEQEKFGQMVEREDGERP